MAGNWLVMNCVEFSPNFGRNPVRKIFDLHFEKMGFKPDRFEDEMFRNREDPLKFRCFTKLGDREEG